MMYPITIGVEIDDRLPHMLNTPPAKPVISFGAVSDITAQPSAPMPLPKNDSAINATMTHWMSV